MRIHWRWFRIPLALVVLLYGLSFIPLVRDSFERALSPLVLFVRHTGEGWLNGLSVIRSIPTVVNENGQLRAQVNELAAQKIKNQELEHENELLRKELSLSSPDRSSNLIAAEVISRSSSVSQQSITVNKGLEDGLTKGMAVIAQGYFVGRVEDALPHTSRVTLLTSVNSLIPVVLQNSRSLGLLKGGATGLIVDEIPRDIAVSVDEAVVTSNTGDIIKSGIPVGKVASVLSGKSDVFQSVKIISPIDLSRLEVVFGVKP